MYHKPNTSWRELIEEAMMYNSDSWGNIVESTLTAEEMDEMFYNGYGSENGRPFTLWTKEWVYFPLEYDGSESVGSAPRNPCKIALRHQ